MPIQRSELMDELPKTEHYHLIVVDDPEHPGTTCYGIKNSDTEVIEYYDNLLPRAYGALVATQGKYSEMLDMIAGKTSMTLVSMENGLPN